MSPDVVPRAGLGLFGKHPFNFVPVMLGVFLGLLAKPWGVADPSILLAALFATNLAPIAIRFSWHARCRAQQQAAQLGSAPHARPVRRQRAKAPMPRSPAGPIPAPEAWWR